MSPATGRSAWAGSRLIARFRDRPDSEHEMALNRLGFAALALAFFAVRGARTHPAAWLASGVYVLLAVGVLAHIAVRPASSGPRRLFAVLLDTAFLSWQLHDGGEPLALFCPLYLWFTFGNGFRFGLAWLRVAMVCAFVGFCIVVATTPFWQQEYHLSVGLLASLLALPAYAGTLIRRLSQARQQAEDANKAKTEFLASVSHELRTPLTAIIGMTSLLQDTVLNFDQLEMTHTIQSAGKSLLGLINGVLDLSRIEVGRMPSAPEPFDLADLLREALSLVTAQARAKGLALSLHVTPHTPLDLIGSRHHLIEILLNLLGNAVKFTERGSVVLAATAEHLMEHSIRLRLEVCDTGIGIKAEAQSRIFETFTQADPKILNRFGGTGLGLSIARRLATLLGGTLTVASAEGSGTTFTLIVELQVDAAAAPRRLAGLGVLLLGQDLAARDALAVRLVALGARVETVQRPEQALWTLRGYGSGQRAVLVALESGLTWSAAKLAAELRKFSPLAEQQTILVAAEEPPEPMPQRGYFASVLAPVHSDAELVAALRVAGGRDLGRADLPPTIARLAEQSRTLNILMADDNLINQQVVGKILARAGHSVTSVGDGEAALEALDEHGETFDLVLMDINMPALDGLEVTKLYRFMALGRRHLPIVALTADASAGLMKACLEAGMEAVVTKPVDPAHLLEVIARLTYAEAEAGAEAGVGASPAAPTEAIASIADHPRFRASAQPPIDETTLQKLAEVGGPEFVTRLIHDFMHEAEAKLFELTEAARRGDIVAFRYQAHALCSSSVNVGARRLGELCAAWQHIGSAEFAAQATHIAVLAATELSRTRHAFLTSHAAAASGDRRG